MHVAIISDTAWLDEELPQFKVLVVGLIDEQVRVAQVVPDQLDITEVSAFGEQVTWTESDYSWLRQYRLLRLAPQLKRLGVDIIHAVDGRLWPGALRLARELGAPLVCAASAANELESAATLIRRAGDQRIAFTAATAPLGEALSQKVGHIAAIEVVTPGLHTPGEIAKPDPQRSALCAVVTGSGHMDDDYKALLQAMSRIIKAHPDAQFFFDAQQSDQHTVWRAARKMNLLSNLSLVPRKLGHHELLLRADVLLQPQPLGQARGLTLQAMARGIPVIARADPWLDYLHHDQSAWVIDDVNADKWFNRIHDVIEHPDAARRLGASARQYIADHHRVVQQLDSLLTLYRQITGEAYKFEQAI